MVAARVVFEELQSVALTGLSQLNGHEEPPGLAHTPAGGEHCQFAAQ